MSTRPSLLADLSCRPRRVSPPQWSEQYNLLASLNSASGTSTSDSASGALRTTRRQISNRKESLAVAPSPVDRKGKGRASYPVPFDLSELLAPPVTPSSSKRNKKTKRPSAVGTSSTPAQTDDDLYLAPPPKKLKYLAFEPPSYTHANHVPTNPIHNRSLDRYLSSITFLTPDDLPIVVTHSQGTPTFLEKQARKEAALQNKIAGLQALGRLGSTANTSTAGGRRVGPPGEKKGELSRHEAMLEHLVFVQKGVIGEGKARVAGAKRISRLVVGYWEKEGGREERERKDEERARKTGARQVGKMIRGKWRLAVNVSVAILFDGRRSLGVDGQES